MKNFNQNNKQNNQNKQGREERKNEQLKVTSLQDLEQYSKGTAVQLPPFADGQPFVARLRRPSLLVLVKSGKIPNELLTTANALFKDGSKGLDEDKTSMLSDIYDVVEAIAEASLIEPTLQQVKDCGLEITDDQLMFLFNYSQNGVKALQNFR